MNTTEGIIRKTRTPRYSIAVRATGTVGARSNQGQGLGQDQNQGQGRTRSRSPVVVTGIGQRSSDTCLGHPHRSLVSLIPTFSPVSGYKVRRAGYHLPPRTGHTNLTLVLASLNRSPSLTLTYHAPAVLIASDVDDQ